jgi:hypothetical protein
MTVMTNPADPLLELLSPNVCHECGQPVPLQGTQVADAIAASIAGSFRMLTAALHPPQAPVHHSAHRQRRRRHHHGRRDPDGFHHGHGRQDCGCAEHRHGECGGCGRHGHGHDWHGHDWHDCGKEGWRRRECWACDDDCRSCDDPCECRCCIPRCDLLVYARLEETRVIPFVIENRRPRERHVTLHLSDWKTVGGGTVGVTTVELEPASFELRPCSRQIAQLKFSTVAEERREVQTCVVAHADLTVEGCDMKPLRIAVAILPMECGPYCIDCSCGCC